MNLVEWHEKIKEELGHDNFAVVYNLMAAKFGVWDLETESFMGSVCWLNMTLEECFTKWLSDWEGNRITAEISKTV